MAAHAIHIAKVSLLASCLRPDHTKLTRDDLIHFHDVLERCLSRCTPSNIQTTKQWLLAHIVPSTTRTTAFIKYLTSLSKHHLSQAEEQGIGSRRRRLHLLYLLNDLLHHTKYHVPASEAAQLAVLQNTLRPALSELFGNAAAGAKKHTRKRLSVLLDVWESEQYLESDVLTQARKSTPLHPVDTQITDVILSKTPPAPKELPWVLPTTHGNSSSAFHDLPAANFMPHIVPNSSAPMQPDQIRALQLSGGPADESLVKAVEDLLNDAHKIEFPFSNLDNDKGNAEMDALGHILFRNEADEITGDTYYGWTRAFCEKMKNRARGRSRTSRDDKRRSFSASLSRSGHDSRSRSRSRSSSPRKRRRYDSSE